MKFILKDWCGVVENVKFNNDIYKILSTYVPAKGIYLKTIDQYASPNLYPPSASKKEHFFIDPSWLPPIFCSHFYYSA